MNKMSCLKNFVRLNSYRNTGQAFSAGKYQNRWSKKKDQLKMHDENYDRTFAGIFQDYELKTAENWKTIRSEVMQTLRHINLSNFDSLALNHCLKTKNYKLAENCLQFMRGENDVGLNISVYGKLFQLYHSMYLDNVFEKNYDEEILKLYDTVKNKYKVLDSISSETIIVALSDSAHWKIGVDLLDKIKLTTTPNNLSYNSLAAAAFTNKEYTIGWDIINDMLNNNRVPADQTYLAILEDCAKSKNRSHANLFKLLNLFHNYDVICTENVAKCLQSTYKSLGYTVTSSNLNNSGKCSACQKMLARVELLPGEFELLKESFFKEVIIGKNLFCKTTSTEIDDFKNFVTNMGKVDVVIDGLNVAYAVGSKSYDLLSRAVASVVNHYVTRGKKVTVLGRLHMNKWPRHDMNFIRQNANVFLAENISYDDPYLLYCALHSGPNTIIVTRDFMRSHAYLLTNEDHKRLFKRWLVQSRHEFVRMYRDGKVVINNPLPYLPIAQESRFGWHIPYLMENDDSTKSNHWICIKK